MEIFIYSSYKKAAKRIRHLEFWNELPDIFLNFDENCLGQAKKTTVDIYKCSQ